MRSLLRLGAALVLPLAACSCASHEYAGNPTPAVLNDRQAMELAGQTLAQRGTPPGVFVNVLPTSDGYIVGYQTDFNPLRRPPEESHLVAVRNEGTAREILFRERK